MSLGIYFKCFILSIASNLIQHGETTQLICQPLLLLPEVQKQYRFDRLLPRNKNLTQSQKNIEVSIFCDFLKIYLFQKNPKKPQNSIVVESTNSVSRLSVFRPWLCHPLAVWPWFNPMDLSFVVSFKMRIIILNYLPHSVAGGIKWVHVYSGLRRVLAINLQQILLLFNQKPTEVSSLCVDYETLRTKFQLELLLQGLNRIASKVDDALIMNKSGFLNLHYLYWVQMFKMRATSCLPWEWRSE